MLDLTNPTTATIVTALLTSVLAWAYAKFVLKDSDAGKVFAKTALSSACAVALVLVVQYNQSSSHSLRSEPFFLSVM